jgi:hypothetical protein
VSAFQRGRVSPSLEVRDRRAIIEEAISGMGANELHGSCERARAQHGRRSVPPEQRGCVTSRGVSDPPRGILSRPGRILEGRSRPDWVSWFVKTIEPSIGLDPKSFESLCCSVGTESYLTRYS